MMILMKFDGKYARFKCAFLRFFLPARTGVRLQVTNKLNKYYIIENKNKFNTCK